jgi:hypothetical protein
MSSLVDIDTGARFSEVDLAGNFYNFVQIVFG